MEHLLPPEQASEPLLRLHLFGVFHIMGRGQTVLPPSLLNSRASGRNVLKLLACSPGRQATRSQLAGILWPETEEERARDSLRSAWTFLRKVLRSVGAEGVLRTNGEVLQLAGQSLLWLDTDAFEDLVARSCRAGSGEEAIALGEEACRLLRGEFLADDQSAEWTTHRLVKRRRQLLWMARSRLTRHLADLYVQRGQIRLAEEMLEAQVTRFPTDQDALYRLLLLLERQGCFEQASILYERARRTLEASGKPLARHVQACFERLQHAASTQPTIPPTSTGRVAVGPASSPPEPLASARHSPFVLASSAGGQPEAPLVGAITTLSSLLAETSSRGEVEMLRLFSALEGRSDMPLLSRRQLLQLGIATFISRLAHLDRKRISAIEQEELANALSQSIANSWQLFHTASNAGVLAIAQLQLSLLREAHGSLSPATRPYLYEGAYNLLGVTLQFQKRNEEALYMYQEAYLAAMATGNSWFIAQNLILQADTCLVLGRYSDAVLALEEALSYLDDTDEEHRRVKAHLLACRADVAMTMEDYILAERMLDESARYLECLPVKEEFDRSSWLQLAGKRAILVKDYTQAETYLKEAARSNPPQLLVRHTGILTLLAITYARQNEREQSFLIARQAIPTLKALNAPLANTHFLDYLQQDIMNHFPIDSEGRTFLAEMQEHFPHLNSFLEGRT